jgi:hypothetical protein
MLHLIRSPIMLSERDVFFLIWILIEKLPAIQQRRKLINPANVIEAKLVRSHQVGTSCIFS